MKLKNIALIITAALAMASSSCAKNPSQTRGPVQHYTLPYNIWSDPWALSAGDMRFFDTEMVMKDFGLSRLAAVELQNHYRDYMDTYYIENNCDHRKNYQQVSYHHYFTIDVAICFNAEIRQAAWNQALQRVRAGEYESGWSQEKLEKAKFVVAFDLDNTLFYQSWHHPKDPIVYAPGWFETLEYVKNHGGAVILFTAKSDDRIRDTVLPVWKVKKDGKEIAIGDYVDAVFTNNHMIMAPGDWDNDSPAVIIPSKDLRVIEESLSKVFIVDDLPSRIVQFELLRHVPRWDPKSFNNIDGGNNIINSPNRLLDAVKEIVESTEWSEQHNTTPAAAFLPYSFAGRQITNQLAIEQFGGDFAKAVEYVRNNPKMVTWLK